jgi:hypothetical protein
VAGKTVKTQVASALVKEEVTDVGPSPSVPLFPGPSSSAPFFPLAALTTRHFDNEGKHDPFLG